MFFAIAGLESVIDAVQRSGWSEVLYDIVAERGASRCPVACFVFLLGLGLWGSAVMADDVQYAKAVSNRLNTTGRAIDMEIPMKDADRALGDIPVRINPDNSVLINKPALSQILSPSWTQDRVSVSRQSQETAHSFP